MPNIGEEVELLELSYTAAASVSTYNHSGKVAYLLYLNICTFYDLALPLLAIHPTEMCVCVCV